MKYSAHLYAKALEAVANDPKLEAKNFMAIVRKNGDEYLLPKILEETERLMARTSGVRKVRIESARPLDAGGEKMVKAFLKPGDIVQKKVSPELVAGIKISLNEELEFDGSLKGKMDRMFANL